MLQFLLIHPISKVKFSTCRAGVITSLTVSPWDGNTTTGISGISKTTLKSLIHSIILDHGQVQLWPTGSDIFVPSALLKSSILPQAHHVERAVHPVLHLPGLSNAIPHAPALGYSHQHALYASEWDHWMKNMYCPPSAETILLEILACHERGSNRGRQHATLFGVSYLMVLWHHLISQCRVFMRARKMSMHLRSLLQNWWPLPTAWSTPGFMHSVQIFHGDMTSSLSVMHHG